LKSEKTTLVLVTIGFFFGVVGLVADGIWRNLLYFGVNWLIAGVVYCLAGREVTKGGVIAAFLFGGVGALFWLFLSLAHAQNESS